MNYTKYKKYVRRVCVYVNNTLNSQIKYWKGQKRDIRDGKHMQWSHRPRSRVGWNIYYRLNAPPKRYNIFSRIYLWSWVWIEGRDKHNLNKLTPYILRWFKYQSFLTHLKRLRGLKWIIQIGYTNCVSA